MVGLSRSLSPQGRTEKHTVNRDESRLSKQLLNIRGEHLQLITETFHAQTPGQNSQHIQKQCAPRMTQTAASVGGSFRQPEHVRVSKCCCVIVGRFRLRVSVKLPQTSISCYSCYLIYNSRNPHHFFGDIMQQINKEAC